MLYEVITPLVHKLCEKVLPGDKAAFIALMKGAEFSPTANLATSLLRAFKNDPELKEIRNEYLNVWRDSTRPLELRFCVIYPLLDDPDVDHNLLVV